MYTHTSGPPLQIFISMKTTQTFIFTSVVFVCTNINSARKENGKESLDIGRVINHLYNGNFYGDSIVILL